MTRSQAVLALVLFATPLTASAQEPIPGRFDYGKMWTFDHPPRDYFVEAYGLEADDGWFQRARMGALRIPGCSASFVSPSGLVLTNHHCARAALASVAEGDENLLDGGFYAASRSEERRIPGFVAEQLVAIEDVTEEVSSAGAAAQTDAERSAAVEAAIASISERMERAHPQDHAVQIVSLYHGGVYSAYVFRQYRDVRLVMAPELQMGYFGGDEDNFTYPRYALDFSLLRVYEGGQPYRTDYYFPWSGEGAEEGQAVFVIGNPGSTFRLETLAQLEYRRDVLDGFVLNLINSRLDALQGFVDQSPEAASAALRNQIFGLLNAQKLYRGRVKALTNPSIMARKAASEADFAAALARDESLNARYGGLLDSMIAVQRQLRSLAPDFGAFLSLAPGSALSSAAERRALLAVEVLDARRLGAEAPRARASLEAIQDLALPLERALLEARLRDMAIYLGNDDPLVTQVLGDATPEARASTLIETSIVSRGQDLLAALQAGDSLSADPMIAWARLVKPRLADYQSAAAGLGARQARLAGALGKARFDVYGTSVPPDATFSLRIADGRIQGYEYNGTLAPAFTTIFGLFDRFYSHPGSSEWALPEGWVSNQQELDLATPLNFTSTADITGGNSGSPVVNADLELVGLVFDGNIESLSGDFIYLDRTQRSVSVDARGILEALRVVYGADRIVEELTASGVGVPVPAGSH